MREVELVFCIANFFVFRLQRGQVKTFFATEVVIDHALTGFGGGGDLIDTRTRKTFFTELLGGDIQDVLLRTGGLIHTPIVAFRARFGV